MLLRSLGTQVWDLNSKLRMPGGVVLPARMSVLGLSDGSVVLISPLDLSEELQAELKNIGKVRYLVGPNAYHHLSLPQFAQAYPSAQVFGVRGLEPKRRDLNFRGFLDDGDKPWDSELLPLTIFGVPKMNETVLFHAASRTLIVTDLLFHMLDAPENGLSSVVFGLMGTRGKLAVSRMVSLIIKDKPSFRTSLEKMLALDFDRLIPAHGAVIETGAKAQVSAAVEKWLR